MNRKTLIVYSGITVHVEDILKLYRHTLHMEEAVVPNKQANMFLKYQWTNITKSTENSKTPFSGLRRPTVSLPLD